MRTFSFLIFAAVLFLGDGAGEFGYFTLVERVCFGY